MVFYYTNSFWAFILSILGSGLTCGGIVTLFSGEAGGGIALIAFGISLFLSGKKISQNKAFQKWWKQVTDANLEPEIQKSTELAIEIYNKNP